MIHFIDNATTKGNEMNELIDCANSIISTRDFCGNERQALRDWQADYRKLSSNEIAAVWAIVNNKWADFQKAAGVHFPVSEEERATITKIMETAP